MVGNGSTLGASGVGLPDTLNTKPSTIRVVQSLGVGGSALYIVTTVSGSVTRMVAATRKAAG